MSEHMLLGLASIIVLGILAQWLAWRLHLPAILLLLVFGFIAGPATGVLDVDGLFGQLLFPLVSVSVAIILFEGGLSLKINEIRKIGGVVTSLVTVGVLVTWVLSALAAHFVIGMALAPAILLGAILVVSGPTVIIPLLRQVRPAGQVGSIMKWEGIVNDPIGAILAVLVFEIILAGDGGGGMTLVWGGLKALVSGTVIGLAGAGVLVLLFRRYLIPDFLQNPVSLMVVVMSYFVADSVQSESGLLAVTVMGVALANQKYVSIKHVLEFKENLRVLLISSLFIILAARLPVSEMGLDSWTSWAFIILLIIVVRPLAVFVSTARSGLKRNEKLFLSWMAPRGIVAAAVSSVFAIRLAEAGIEGAEMLGTVTFHVIVATVAVYGLTASPVARWLKVARPNPQGVLFVGASRWVRSVAELLKNEGYQVALVDSNWANVTEARSAGCRAFYGNVLSEEMLYELQLDGIGKLLALTPNDEVNALSALHFVDVFGRSDVYQLPPSDDGPHKKPEGIPSHLRGRYLFHKKATFHYLTSRIQSGAVVKRTHLTAEFGYEDYQKLYMDMALPLFVITESGDLKVWTAKDSPAPKAGQRLISIVDDTDKPHHEKNGKSG